MENEAEMVKECRNIWHVLIKIVCFISSILKFKENIV